MNNTTIDFLNSFCSASTSKKEVSELYWKEKELAKKILENPDKTGLDTLIGREFMEIKNELDFRFILGNIYNSEELNLLYRLL